MKILSRSDRIYGSNENLEDGKIEGHRIHERNETVMLKAMYLGSFFHNEEVIPSFFTTAKLCKHKSRLNMIRAI